MAWRERKRGRVREGERFGEKERWVERERWGELGCEARVIVTTCIC
jgi:hypothetical protein